MQDNTKFQLIEGPMAMIHEGVKPLKRKETITTEWNLQVSSSFPQRIRS